MNVKALIGILLAAEAVLLLKGGGAHLPSGGSLSLAGFGKPQVVDRKWAAEMARKASAEADAAAKRASHRSALAACVGPNGPSMSPSRLEKAEKLCEAQMAAAAAAPPEPEPGYHIGPPPPLPQQPPVAGSEVAERVAETGA
jgi:hypothetical protein